MTGTLRDALTGRDDGRQTLEILERGNLFVVPPNDQRQWCPSWQTMASLGTPIVPPGSRLPPADTPGTSAATTPPQVTASLRDFTVPLGVFKLISR